jgi:MscS family membrane protein
MRLDRIIRTALLLYLVLAAHRAAGMQVAGLSVPAPSAAKPVEGDSLGRDTPYGCVVGFLKAAERGEYAHAADYLDIKSPENTNEVVRQLYKIMNTGGAVELDTIVRDPEGDLKDGLPVSRERVGTIDIDGGTFDILLARVQRDGKPPIWLVAPETLRRVPAVFEQIEPDRIEKLVPERLREIRILGLPLARWIGTLFGILIVIGFATLASRLLFPVLRPLIRRATREADDRRLAAVRAPFWLILLAGCFRALGTFTLRALSRQFWITFAQVLAVVGAAWLAIRVSNIVIELAGRRLSRAQMASKMAVLLLLHRLFKIGVAVLAAVTMVWLLGGEVKTVLAGVGLGGIAIAFAAQKTLENLFGGVSLISDQPIRVGDFCRFADKFGTVEDIGLRSTRIRTLARTVLSIPNGQLSLMHLENFTLRDKCLINQKIGLRYETTPDQIRYILTEIQEMLRNHPGVFQEDWRVRLTEFGASAFTIEIFAYLLTDDHLVYLETQEELLLSIFDLIVAAGSGLAFPCQTTYLTRDKGHAPARVKEAESRIQERRKQVISKAAS